MIMLLRLMDLFELTLLLMPVGQVINKKIVGRLWEGKCDVVMADDDEEKMSKAQRLAIAAAVAPALSSTKPSRRISRVDSTGNIVGYISHIELARILLAKKKIEIEVVEGLRPKEAFCQDCGKIVSVPKTGRPAKRCGPCKYQHQYDVRMHYNDNEVRQVREVKPPIPKKITCIDCNEVEAVSPYSTVTPTRCSDCRYKWNNWKAGQAAKMKRARDKANT